jgi:hypothetical protein
MALYAVETIIFKIYNIMKLQKVIALVAFVCISTAVFAQSDKELSAQYAKEIAQKQIDIKQVKVDLKQAKFAEKQGQNPGESSYAVKMRLKQQQAELKELKKKKKTIDTAIKTKEKAEKAAEKASKAKEKAEKAAKAASELR